MQDVRDINEAQQRELTADRDRMQALQAKRRDLTQQLDEARQATQAQSDELQVICSPKTSLRHHTQRPAGNSSCSPMHLPANCAKLPKCCSVASLAEEMILHAAKHALLFCYVRACGAACG